ncbi:MAG: hypothetical protein RIT45_3432 [Pseudomonadota bacterium]|jgi:tetratricopeptide (TPR) repeat protein
MDCPRCGHENVSSFRFCEVCLAPLAPQDAASSDVVGRFFDEADLLEASPIVSSRGATAPARFDLPWLPEGHRSDLMGRDTEVAKVAEGLITGLQNRTGSYRLVRGEVGSGRSRLLTAVCDAIRSAAPDARFLVTSAQGCHRPYSLIERLLRLRFDIPDYLGGTIAGERFERAGEALFGDATGAEVARTCGPMLGFHFWNEHDIDFEDRLEASRRASEALHTLWMRDLGEAPSVIVVDDAGEADAESLTFLADLRSDVAALPVAFIFAANQRGTLRRSWLESLDVYELKPLDAAAMRRICETATVGLNGATDALRATLIEHAEGRPGTLLAALEAAQKGGAIQASGNAWVVDPDALGKLLDRGRLKPRHGGRFDLLSEDELLIARLGAIFGPRFWLGGVTALIRIGEQAPRALSELGQDGVPERVAAATATLTDNGILVRERSALLAHETAFRFVEAADVDKLLELTSTDERRRLSQRAAVWLEAVGKQRSIDLAEIRAPLWLAAGEKDHAAHLYLIAGERAFEELRHEEAVRYLDKARVLAADSAIDVHISASMALGDLAELDGRADEAESLWREALALSWTLRARAQGAHALARIGRQLRVRGKIEEALEHLVEAVRLFEAVGERANIAATCDDIGRAYWTSGHIKPAARFLQRAAEIRERDGDRVGLAGTLTNLGILALSMGQPDRARRHLERAVKLRREARKFAALIESLNALGALHLQCGETDAAVSAMEEAYDLSKRVGNRRMQAMLQNNLGEVLLSSGRIDDAENLLYKAVEGAGRLDDHNLLSDAARNLAAAARVRDDATRAITWARRSVAAAQLSALSRVRAAAMGTLAEVLADAGDVDAADNAFRRAAELWTEANDRSSLVALLQAHAAFYVRHERGDEASELLTRVDHVQAGRRTSRTTGQTS